MKHICVIGTGYVGLVNATCFAELGNSVVTVDIDERKIDSLNNGEMPIYEPGLAEIVDRNVRAGRLSFTTSYEEGLRNAEFAFICVGTPEGEDGEAELKYVRAAAASIAVHMTKPLIIINKSTVPVGTGDIVANVVTNNLPKPIQFGVVSCPEFLREGAAVQDFMFPDRTVLGSTDEDRWAAEAVAQLYLSLRAPIVMTDLRTAEMIKYASNAFLATRLSFINEIANICEKLGADVIEVAQGMGFDKRIGHHFMQPGIGYGGSCFPKDVKALTYMAAAAGAHPQLLTAVTEINSFQRRQVANKLHELLGDVTGKIVTILGLAFKENTDDVRESPSLDIAKLLLDRGAIVRGYDPVAMDTAGSAVPEIIMCETPYDAVSGADAVVIGTPWNEFKQLDMERVLKLLTQPIVIDGRNIYDPQRMKELGFRYRGIGRGYNGDA